MRLLDKQKSEKIIWTGIVQIREVFSATWGQVSYDNNLRATPRRRCEKCSKRQSNLEYIVEQYLIKNIEYIKQYRFDDRRNKKPCHSTFIYQNIIR